jgi:hypothetical protein
MQIQPHKNSSQFHLHPSLDFCTPSGQEQLYDQLFHDRKNKLPSLPSTCSTGGKDYASMAEVNGVTTVLLDIGKLQHLISFIGAALLHHCASAPT